MKTCFIVVIFCILTIHCKQSNQIGSIVIGNERIEGNISADTIFNDVIKRYDLPTGKLLSETEYENGKFNGRRKVFHKNGKLIFEGNYLSDLRHGVNTYYNNQTGNLESTDNFYYGIRVGPSVEYKGNKINTYRFYSLCNDILIHLNYDSVKTSSIDVLMNEYFFYDLKEITSVDNSGSEKDSVEYFLYTPNPPELSFKYDLVLVNEAYDSIRLVKSFTDQDLWATFSIDPNLNHGELKYSLRLRFYDPFFRKTASVYKVL
jgi:hypothetical protein